MKCINDVDKQSIGKQIRFESTKIKGFWWWGSIVVALILALDWPWSMLAVARNSDLVMFDLIDQLYIVDALERAHTFRETLMWWYGQWSRSDLSFYRPLTSLVWWLQFQAFGGKEHGALGFTVVHLLLHAGVCALLLGFLRRLIGDRGALVAVVLWASGFAEKFTLPTPLPALGYWRDDPEMWTFIWCLLCLGSLLSYWQTGKRWFYAGAIAALVMGICFKEMAYIFPVLALLLLWHQKKCDMTVPMKARIWSICGLFAINSVAFIYRCWALQGFGSRYGSNGSWLHRWALSVAGGRPAYMIVHGMIGAWGVVLGIIALWALYQRRYLLAGILAALCAGFIFVNDTVMGIPWQTFYQLMLPFPLWKGGIYGDIVNSFVVLAVWLGCLKYRNRTLILGLTWGAIAYLPLLSCAVLEHAMYLPSIGWAICLTGLVLWVWAQAENLWAMRIEAITPSPAKTAVAVLSCE